MVVQRVALIVVTWQSRDYLPACLEAIKSQSLSPDELIFIDNGSTDGTANLIEVDLPFALLLRFRQNLGFAAAVNCAVTHATTDLIALLNPDTEPEPEWLENLVLGAERYPWASMFASRMQRMDRDEEGRRLIDSAGDSLTGAGHMVKDGSGQPDGPPFYEDREMIGACAGAALYRRSMLQQIGGFDEWFFHTCEDGDLALRGQLAGHKCVYVSSAVVRHHVGAGRRREPGMAAFLASRNQLATMIMNLPERVLLNALVPFLFMEAFGLAKRFFQKRGFVPHVQGRYAALKDLKRLRRLRSERFQKQREGTSEFILEMTDWGWPWRRAAAKILGLLGLELDSPPRAGRSLVSD